MSGAVPAEMHRQMVKTKCVHVQITLVKKNVFPHWSNHAENSQITVAEESKHLCKEN